MFQGLLGEALYAGELVRMGIDAEVAKNIAHQCMLWRAAEAAGIRGDFGPNVVNVDFIGKRVLP